MATHTRGPLIGPHYGNESVSCNCRYILCDTLMGCVATIQTSDDFDESDAYRNEYPPPEEAAGNGRLLTAAFNSYDRHCGENAVKAAEEDLLGKALQALKEAQLLAAYAIGAMTGGCDPLPHEKANADRCALEARRIQDQIRAVLAMTEGVVIDA